MVEDIANRNCPLCNSIIKDILKHLRLQHDIGDSNKLEQELMKIERKKSDQKNFSDFIDTLKEKKKNNEITSEEYRKLVEEWMTKKRNRSN